MIATLRRVPVAVGLALLLLVVNVVSGAVLRAPGPALRTGFGLGAERLILGHDAPSLVTSVLLANGPAEMVVAVVAIVVVVGLVERLTGHWRALLAYAATAVGGGLLGTAAQAAGLLTRGVWSTPPADLQVLHPFTPIFGAAMAGSAFAGPLWRRRVRLLGLAGLIVVLLYSGQPGDLYRLAGALVGLVLGMVLARDRPRPTWPRSSHHEARTLLAVVVAISAVGPLVALFQRSGYGILRPLGLLFADPLPAAAQVHRACLGAQRSGCAHTLLLSRLNSPGTIVLDVLPLVVLLIAAVGIRSGRRSGAWAAVLVNLVLGALAAIYYNLLPTLRSGAHLAARAGGGGVTLQTLLAVALPLAAAVAVLVELRHLPVRARPRALVLSSAWVVAVVVVGFTAYVVAGSADPRGFTPRAGTAVLLRDAAERYVPIGFLRLHRLGSVPTTPLTRLLSDWIGPAAWVALAVAVVVCCLAVRRPRTAAEESRIREVLRTGSTGSISYMATWPGNRYWFSDDGRHAVAYREGSGAAITLGEPIGPADGAIEAGRAFAIACDDRAVIPAFYAVRQEFADAIGQGVPWGSMPIGEDTVLDVATFSMKGKQWQDVRSSVNRADRLGIRAVWTDWQSLSATARAQVEAISEEWIADRRLPELGFTLGGIEELRDREVKLMLAVGPEDRIEAVTSWLPSWRDGAAVGWTLDFMRRRAGSMNGVMEFLIASTAMAAQQRELEFVSLSVAPLASTTPHEPDGVHQLLELMSRTLEPAYGFASLANFKAKFKPSYVPNVLAYPDAVSLPAISVALGRAYLPDLGIGGVARLLGALRPEPAPVHAAPVSAGPVSAVPIGAAAQEEGAPPSGPPAA